MKFSFFLTASFFVILAGYAASFKALAAPEVGVGDGSRQPLSANVIYYSNDPSTIVMWYVHFATDGKISVVVQGGRSCGYCSKTINYAPNSALHVLFNDAVVNSKFFQLDKVIGQTKSIPDRPVRTLVVTRGAIQSRVELHDTSTVNKTEEVNRFFMVWDALLSEVPDELEGKHLR